MAKQYLLVKTDFNPTKDYGMNIRKQYAKCLSLLKKGQKVNPKEFAAEFGHEFTRKNTVKAREEAVYHCFMVGKKIGILRPLSDTENGLAISFRDFCKQGTVAYFMKQHKGSRYKNIKSKSVAGTSGTYAYRLWNFNNWLHNREFEFTRITPTGKDTFRKKTEKIKLKGLEHLLELYNETNLEREFVKIAKSYLLDPINEKQSANSMKMIYNAIKSYFEKNDNPLNFKFDPKARHKTRTDEDEQASLSLDELMQLLTVGNPTLSQKTAFLCKFHRGLDTSTFVDRFNFEAWGQLVSHFETDDYENWNLKKCPVPILLTRIKTACSHTGFLEFDAVHSLQKYLAHREKQTGRKIIDGEGIILTERKKPVDRQWITSTMKKLRKNAGLDKKLSGYSTTRYKINSHEFRDLLKSTLLDCNVRPDLAEHFIGHKPKDSYEKQASLYPKSLEREYSKAAKRLNIFSNFASMVKGHGKSEEMQERLSKMESDMQKVKKRITRTDKLRRKL